jgi:hypothetical protein
MKTLTCVALCLAVCFSAVGADSLNSLAIKYKQCKVEAEKRALCVEALDEGVIGTGTPIADIKRVFQKDFEECGLDANGKDNAAIVHFVPPLRSTNSLVSDLWRGWYLALTYNKDGIVMTYYITNMGKEAAVKAGLKRRNRNDSGPGLPRVDNEAPRDKPGSEEVLKR